MIDTTVTFLQTQLNDYLKLKLNSASDLVMLTNMFEVAGEQTAVEEGKVGMTVVNIEEERITKVQTPYKRDAVGVLEKTNPEIKLNVYLLFAANSADMDYTLSLKLISKVIHFFQGKNVFTPENSPSLAPSISRLMLDLYTVPLEQQSYLWGALGAQYLPSVVYKVRVLHVQDDRPLGSPMEVTGLDTNVSNT